MVCIHCGEENTGDARFCVNCGQPQERPQTAAARGGLSWLWFFLVAGPLILLALAIGYILSPESDPEQVEVTRIVAAPANEVTRLVVESVPLEVTRVVQEFITEQEVVEVTRLVQQEVVVEVEVTRVVEVTRIVESSNNQSVVVTNRSGDTLETVRQRGSVKCGLGAGTSPGFATISSEGVWHGFNVDFCRAIAIAILGDSEAFEPVITTGTTRFPILQSGEADLLVNNTTWTTSRDTALGFNFGPIIFYDGQGFIVRTDSGIDSVEDLGGRSVCVFKGTTTERTLEELLLTDAVSFELVPYEDYNQMSVDFAAGICDAWSTDKSFLITAAFIFAESGLTDVRILDETLSKEPLGVVVRHGDDNWLDVVSWVVHCTVAAEEYGISRANVQASRGSDNWQILNLLGIEGDLGFSLGLSNDFCFNILQQVGNYGEIFERHLGSIAINRGLNALWTEGGLMYAPPFR